LRLVRTKSRLPSQSSSRRICGLMAPRVTLRSSAARMKLPSRAAASKALIAFNGGRRGRTTSSVFLTPVVRTSRLSSNRHIAKSFGGAGRALASNASPRLHHDDCGSLNRYRACSKKAPVLWVACGAHALHDGFTDTLYVLLPLWQAQFALSYAAIGILRALYAGVMAGLQVPSVDGELRRLRKGQLSSFGMGGSRRGGAACEPPHNIDQLVVCGAGRILELIGRVLVSEPAKPQQLAHTLSPI
jgi:hypothetical protein